VVEWTQIDSAACVGGGQTQGGGDADGWERAARGKPGECGLGSKLLVGAAGKQRDEGQT